MASRGSSIVRRSLPEIQTTLSYLDPEEEDEGEVGNVTDKAEKWVETTKTEKSVHFATEYESVTDEEESTPDSLKTSRGVHTLPPSEHLYSGDTFISDSRTADSTDPSYNTNTFIASESEDETRTASDISHTASIASSTVFSPPGSTSADVSASVVDESSASSASREWKDVTDIVKDIDELEESEFVTKRESFWSEEEEATDVTESEDEEMAAIQREHFLLSTIRRLRLRDVLSPRSLAVDLPSESQSESELMPTKILSREEAAFCDKMINSCLNVKEGSTQPGAERTRVKAKPLPLEHYGLSSSIVDRLKMDNFQQRLAKKSAELENSAKQSLKFTEDRQEVEADMLRQKFISQSVGRVQRENMDDCIQAHLIKMHPIKCFAEFVNGLPKHDENSREILYKYKRKLEAEMEKG